MDRPVKCKAKTVKGKDCNCGAVIDGYCIRHWTVKNGLNIRSTLEGDVKHMRSNSFNMEV